MTEDALRGERLIAMALLETGWEQGYDGNPVILPLGCAGLIEEEVRLPDGRFNIRLRGLARIEFLTFVQTSPYRIARVRVLEDRNDRDGPQVERDKKRLLAVCAGLLQEVSGRDSPAGSERGDPAQSGDPRHHLSDLVVRSRCAGREPEGQSPVGEPVARDRLGGVPERLVADGVGRENAGGVLDVIGGDAACGERR